MNNPRFHECVQIGRIVAIERDLVKLEAKQADHAQRVCDLLERIGRELSLIQSRMSEEISALRSDIRAASVSVSPCRNKRRKSNA